MSRRRRTSGFLLKPLCDLSSSTYRMQQQANSSLSSTSSKPHREILLTGRLLYIIIVSIIDYRIFGKTLASILENLENYLLNCFDAVGIMLLIKVTHGQRLVMQRRRIPVLDPFFDKFNLLLWPRFQKVFHANITGIRSAHPKKLGNIELTPHYVSKYTHIGIEHSC